MFNLRKVPALISITLAAGLISVAAHAQGVSVSSPHAILVDYETGTVLFEKKADEATPPASMAKLMTMAVVFGELKAGKISLDTEYEVSLHAWRTGGAPSGGSTMFAALKSKIRVEDLIQGAVVVSGNDACIILAEGIAGNEGAFVDRMNTLAGKLGLASAQFRNPTGLHHPEQAISVRDLARLARHLISNYPDYYKYYSVPELTWSKIRQSNRNPLLSLSLGADGLKTGYIKESGYGIVGSAVQNGHRLIVVINGARTEKERIEDAKKLLEWGFRAFEPQLLFSTRAPIAYAKVYGGEDGSVPLVGKGDIFLRTLRGSNDRLWVRVFYTGPLRAPVKKGTEVARLRVIRAEQQVLDIPLYAGADVAEGGTFGRAVDAVTEFAIGLIRDGFKAALSRKS